MTLPLLADSNVINESGTGYQITRVLQTPDRRLLWQRSPGRDNPETYPPIPASALARLTALDTPTLRFAAPLHATPTQHTWQVHGRYSFAALMVPAENDSDDRLTCLITNLGSRLRTLHDTSAGTGDDLGPPRSHERLHHYLTSGRGPRAAAAFHYRLRTQLGTARWTTLQDYTEHMRTRPDPHSTVLLHGWCSLGSLVVPDPPHLQPDTAPQPPAAHLLTGSEIAAGHRETDLSCLLGELIEYTAAARHAGLDWPLPDRLRTALLNAYGDNFDDATLAAGCIVRIATHALAVAAFHGWNDQLHGYIPMLAELLENDGHAALTSTY
ncbi:hypothetical protein [Actinacidiphila sp. bgisy167]|uniref:hypothetical protein n=1 Tax=Actinacidiphila sp. bgisy167 TaxID=3413797 RepID=UPI003D765A07